MGAFSWPTEVSSSHHTPGARLWAISYCCRRHSVWDNPQLWTFLPKEPTSPAGQPAGDFLPTDARRQCAALIAETPQGRPACGGDCRRHVPQRGSAALLLPSLSALPDSAALPTAGSRHAARPPAKPSSPLRRTRRKKRTRQGCAVRRARRPSGLRPAGRACAESGDQRCALTGARSSAVAADSARTVSAGRPAGRGVASAPDKRPGSARNNRGSPGSPARRRNGNRARPGGRLATCRCGR